MPLLGLTQIFKFVYNGAEHLFGGEDGLRGVFERELSERKNKLERVENC
jgi:hypothetical protein